MSEAVEIPDPDARIDDTEHLSMKRSSEQPNEIDWTHKGFQHYFVGDGDPSTLVFSIYCFPGTGFNDKEY